MTIEFILAASINRWSLARAGYLRNGSVEFRNGLPTKGPWYEGPLTWYTSWGPGGPPNPHFGGPPYDPPIY